MRALLPLLLCVGCSAPVADYSGQFVPAIAIACGVATVSEGVAPVAPAHRCATCGDKGRLPIRDTGRFEDCPDCDKNPALSAAEPQGTAEGHEAPAVEWLTWSEASALSKETGRPVLVLQRYRDPKDDAACLPCQRLKKTLADNATLNAFAELGIPCLGYADKWQEKGAELQAPMLSLVQPNAAESDPVQSLSDFRVAPADAFLSDLRKWINGLEK